MLSPFQKVIFLFISILFLSDVVSAQNKNSGYWKLISTPDSHEFRAWVQANDRNPQKWIILFHDWTGANNSIIKEAQLFAKQYRDYNVICPDLLDGKTGISANTSKEYNHDIESTRCRQIIYGLQQFVGYRSDVIVVGWSFGGYWAMESCALFSKPPIACISYYSLPVSSDELLREMNTPLFHIFAGQDERVSRNDLNTFEQNIKLYQLDAEIIEIDCPSDFSNPSLPQFDKHIDRLTRREVFRFIDSVLEVP